MLVGLIYGKVGRIGPFLTTMPHTAGQTMADFGLLAFLAHAGTRAGTQLGTALASGDGARILLLGAVITVGVSVGMFVVMRRVFGMGRTRLSGVLAAAHTQPSVLAFAKGRTGYDSRVAHGYALVYPAALIAKVLNEDPAEAVAAGEDTPAALSALIARLLAKEPEARPSSATELLSLLDQIG